MSRKPTPLRPERGKRKKPKPRNLKDPAYLDFVREQPCAVCHSIGVRRITGLCTGDVRGLSMPVQSSPTESAHVGVRGLMQKSSDRETLPLCANHHRLDRYSAHRLGKNFAQQWGLSIPALVRQLRKAYEEQR